jgi:hypothetical protein
MQQLLGVNNPGNKQRMILGNLMMAQLQYQYFWRTNPNGNPYPSAIDPIR